MNEAETCRTMVRPKLEAVGWEANGERHFREQIPITTGRIVLAGGKPKRQKKKVPDFLLCYTRDVPLAVVEAKSDTKPAANGFQQAKDYARLLGLRLAYATNGITIIEYSFFTQLETKRIDFPALRRSWQFQQAGKDFSSPAGAIC